MNIQFLPETTAVDLSVEHLNKLQPFPKIAIREPNPEASERLQVINKVIEGMNLIRLANKVYLMGLLPEEETEEENKAFHALDLGHLSDEKNKNTPLVRLYTNAMTIVDIHEAYRKVLRLASLYDKDGQEVEAVRMLNRAMEQLLQANPQIDRQSYISSGVKQIDSSEIDQIKEELSSYVHDVGNAFVGLKGGLQLRKMGSQGMSARNTSLNSSLKALDSAFESAESLFSQEYPHEQITLGRLQSDLEKYLSLGLEGMGIDYKGPEIVEEFARLKIDWSEKWVVSLLENIVINAGKTYQWRRIFRPNRDSDPVEVSVIMKKTADGKSIELIFEDWGRGFSQEQIDNQQFKGSDWSPKCDLKDDLVPENIQEILQANPPESAQVPTGQGIGMKHNKQILEEKYNIKMILGNTRHGSQIILEIPLLH